jgi:hypothetical protein
MTPILRMKFTSGPALPAMVFVPARKLPPRQESPRRRPAGPLPSLKLAGTAKREDLKRNANVEPQVGAEARAERAQKPLEGTAGLLEGLREGPWSTPEQKRAGRPRRLTPAARQQLLHTLGLGQSRSLAAAWLGIHDSTITRSIQRDPELAREVRAAEEEGVRFLAIYDRLHNLENVVFCQGIVIAEPELERAKQYLIGKGLPAAKIGRIRERKLEDGPPPPLPPEPPPHLRQHQEIRIKPWRGRKGK